jgi:hypothetical protein
VREGGMASAFGSVKILMMAGPLCLNPFESANSTALASYSAISIDAANFTKSRFAY